MPSSLQTAEVHYLRAEKTVLQSILRQHKELKVRQGGVQVLVAATNSASCWYLR